MFARKGVIVYVGFLGVMGLSVAHKCFFADGLNPNLPSSAEIQKCIVDSGICYKATTISKANLSQTNEVTTINYSWGCYSEEDSVASYGGGYNCNGGVVEQSSASYYLNTPTFYYYRQCLCCGDSCNDASMDGVCNGEPFYNHKCIGASMLLGTDEPQKIPDNAIPIPCTETQACSKVTNVAFYDWGCSSLPQANMQCGNKTIGYDQFGNYIKVCTCCDELCNDNSMDWILANDPKCKPDDPDEMPPTQKPQGTRWCYDFSDKGSSIPANATLKDCLSQDAICAKHLEVTYFNYGTPQQTESFYYTWGCFSINDYFEQDQGGFHCDDTYEQSQGSSIGSGEKTWFTYSKFCLCCGNKCNGAELDDRCNEKPTFTHTCMTALEQNDDDQNLPSNAIEMPCTSKQQCSKTSSKYSTNQAYYQWGCTSMPDQQCGSHSAGTDGHGTFQKVCTCCGDKCNDGRMNWISAADDKCEKALQPQDDPTLTIVAAILGALTGIVLIALGGALFYIMRLRKLVVPTTNGAPIDKLPIIPNEVAAE